jgi:hypothetical protein
MFVLIATVVGISILYALGLFGFGLAGFIWDTTKRWLLLQSVLLSVGSSLMVSAANSACGLTEAWLTMTYVVTIAISSIGILSGMWYAARLAARERAEANASNDQPTDEGR